MSEYPEHEKVRATQERSQAIGEFLDFGPYTLCEWKQCDVPRWIDDFTGEPSTPFARRASEHPDWFPTGYYPVQRSIQRILAEHFGVDLDRLDAEKRDMIERLREANARRG